MPNDVDIVNVALTLLGQQRILSLSPPDNVKAARSAAAIYEVERDAELRAHLWNFAVKRILLPALVVPPVFGYTAAYQLPDDCIRVIQAGRWVPGLQRWLGIVTSEASDWRVEGKTVSNQMTGFNAPIAPTGPLPLRYIARVTDPTMFDPGFVEAFACRLAMKLAEDVTQKDSKRDLAQTEYKAAIIAAIRSDSIELPPDPLPDNSWLIARLPG
jgi:hypothetical protein